MIHADVLDNGLIVLHDDVTALYICSEEPTTHTEASGTFALGVKAEPTVGEPGSAVGGRQVTVSAISDGIVSVTGEATHWALVDADRLLAAGPLSEEVAVTAENQFTLTEFTIGIVT